jgi:hypothetical protein
MVELALIDADCDANGHPTECTEPAPGTITQNQSNNITVTNGGQTKEVATENDTLSFDSHAHDYADVDDDDSKECANLQSHEITATGEPSITVNGTPVLIVESDVATDPGSGGPVDIESNPFTTARTQ